MSLINTTGIFALVFNNLNIYVFGSPVVTSVVMLLSTLIIALLIRIPLSVALALLVPVTIVLMSLGWLPLVVGGIIVVVLVVMSALSIKAVMN